MELTIVRDAIRAWNAHQAWDQRRILLPLDIEGTEEPASADMVIAFFCGAASERAAAVEAEIRGRDMITGLPKTVTLSSAEVRQALEEPVNQIVEAIKVTLDKTPPELASDIMDRGIVLAGGGALLRCRASARFL